MQTVRIMRRPNFSPTASSVLWLSVMVGLLVVATLLLSWLSYDGSIGQTPVPDVVAQGVALACWALLLLAAHRHCPDAVARVTSAGACMLSRRTRELTVVTCVAVTIVLLLTASVTLRTFPNSADEYAAVFQADTLAAGRLWNAAPPHPDAFATNHILIKDGKWVGKYPPGWPAVIAAGNALGVPAWAINPLLGLASLLVFYMLCRRLGPPTMAVAGVALLGGNAFFIFNSASFFSHTLVLLGGLVFVLSAVRFQERADWRDGLAAGLALGVVGVTRHLEAVLLALPFFVSLAWSGPVRGNRRTAGWIVAGGIPFLVALLLYYDGVTGSPLLPTMQWYDPDDTIKFFAARPELHGGSYGLLILALRIIEWSQWTSPMVLMLYSAAFLIKICQRDLRFFDFYLITFIAGYFFYWGVGGERYGPRYYYPALPFVLLTILTGAVHALRWPATARFRHLVAFSLATMLLIMVSHVPLWSVRMNAIVDGRIDLYRRVAEKGLKNVVVLLADSTNPTCPMLPMDLTRNGVEVDGRPVLYLRDLGARNTELAALYPDREFWAYRCATDEEAGALEPYQVQADPWGYAR